MQRYATIVIVAALAVFAYVGRDSVIIPLLDRLQSDDSEIAGCLRLSEGEETVGLNEPITLVDGRGSHEPVHGTVEKNSTLYLSLIHISEPTRLLSISYAVFCLKKKK